MSEKRLVDELRRELARAEKASARAAKRRAALPPGSSRTRVTTANANWMRAAEYRELISRKLQEALSE